MFSCRITIALFAIALASVHVYAQAAATILEVDKPIERELKGGEGHQFRVNLQTAQYVHLTADQRGIDVMVGVVSPGQERLLEINWLAGTKDPELVWFISPSAGEYIIEVKSANPKGKPGRYELRLKDLRLATADDRSYVEASDRIRDAANELAERKPDSVPNALKKIADAVGGIRLVSDGRRRAIGLSQISTVYFSARDYAAAADYGKEAAELFEPEGMKNEAFFEYLNLGTSYSWIFRKGDSIKCYQKALSIAEELQNLDFKGIALTKLGSLYSELADFDRALKYYEQALSIGQEANDKGAILAGLLNSGRAYSDMGNYAKALALYHEHQKLQKETGITGSEISVLVNIGNVYSAQGNLDLGRQYFEEALAKFKAGNMAIGESVALSNLGKVYADRGEYARALDYFEQARKVGERIKLPLTTTFLNIGLAHKRGGNFAMALEYYLKALEAAERSGNNFLRAETFSLLGELSLEQGEIDKASEYADKALTLARERFYARTEGRSLTLKGRIEMVRGQHDKASALLKQSIEIVENIRKESGEAGGSGFFVSEPFTLFVESMAARGDVGEAFAVAERTKARMLLDTIKNAKLDLARFLTPEESERDRRVRLEMNALNSQIAVERDKPKVNTKTVNELKEKLGRKRLELEDLRTRLYATYPQLRIQRADLKEETLEDAARVLSHESIAIEFVKSEKKLFLFVVSVDATGTSASRVVTIDVNTDQMAARITTLRDKISAGDLDFQRVSRELYNLIIHPVENELAGKREVIIVPDGPLWDLPFQVLMNAKGKYLIEKTAVSYAPSLTALAQMRKKARDRARLPNSELLAFGNPVVGSETKARVRRVFMSEKLEPIPEAERLVNSLAKMYGPTRSIVFTGANAREETAKTEAPKYRIIQFATHGILNNFSPMYSHLVMAQNDKNPNEDGLLEAWELKDLDLKADMVILSACDTARGKISGGEGVIGMTWAAFIAGAPTTVASQWKVESSSTTEFMLEFHRQMLANKKISKAEALRRASLKLMRSTKYRHPSYWAPWVLVGDGS